MAHVYLAAAHRSSGKTTLSIGLTRELKQRGLRVQPFKKGPDYIDPLWLSQAAGRSCLNLDFHTTPRVEIRDAFARTCADADLCVIEGNVGLFDSVDLLGANSNAELAKLLDAPVVLVLDVRGMARGIAPLLLGYKAFDPALQIAGVILNKTGGSRHESNLRRVVEYYTDIPVIGCVARGGELSISERHLGLMPSNETQTAEATIERIRRAVADQIDLARFQEIAAGAPMRRPGPLPEPSRPPSAESPVRIGVAQDEAFGFYYPDDLAALERAGGELIPFSPVRDPVVPEVDGLFIGGGFPEFRMRELEDNASMRASVADFIASGGPAYAECGGLMYLARNLSWGDQRRRMCGVLDADVAMHERPQGRGYMLLRETEAFPWRGLTPARVEIAAHEFHHSAVVAPNPDWTYGYDVIRGTGIDGRHDGVVHQNLLASYAHLRGVGGVAWPQRFVERIRALI